MTLTPFSRSQEGLRLLENGFSTPYLQNEWMDFDLLVHLYCCDMEKNCLDFGDLELIFKVTQGLGLLKNGLSAPYHEEIDGF